MLRQPAFYFAVTCSIFAGFVNIGLGAEKTEQGELIQIPNGFDFKPNFKIYRGNGKPLGAVTSFDPKSEADIGADITYYVDIAKGDDANSGLEKENPLKSLWHALEKKGPKNIIIAEGRYDYENGWKGVQSSEPFSLVSSGGTAVITTHIPVEFKLSGSNTYKAVKRHKELWGNVVDLLQLEKNRVLIKAEKLPLNPGEYYVDGNDLYVRTFDNRKPDKNILTLLAEPGKSPIVLNDCYIENVELLGGFNCLKAMIPEGKSITLNQVTARYSHGGPGFQFSLAGHANMYKCRGYNNYSDDFNWHALGDKSGTCVEINSISRFAGRNNKTISVNASTIHDKIKIIRVNGDYRFAQNRVIADVGHSRSWNIACVASSSRHSDNKTPWWSQNWNFAEDTSAWIDTCIGGNNNDSSKRGWCAEKNAQLYFHNTDYTSGDTHFNKKPIEY